MYIIFIIYNFLIKLDETPENSSLFLDVCDGMNVLMMCQEFSVADITRNMMGLLVC